MKRSLTISAILLSTACMSQNPSMGLNTDFQYFKNDAGQVLAAGDVTDLENIDSVTSELEGLHVPPWKAKLRTGAWKFWYPNGNLKAEMNFRIFLYDDCCFAGYCKQPYELRTGPFRIFYPDGKVMIEGKFRRRPTRIKTSCAGGAQIWKTKIDSDSQVFDEAGNRTTMDRIELNPMDF